MPVVDGAPPARAGSSPAPARPRAEPQVEAGRLHLVLADLLDRLHLARPHQRPDLLRRQQPGRVRGWRARRALLAEEFARLVPRHFRLL